MKVFFYTSVIGSVAYTTYRRPNGKMGYYAEGLFYPSFNAMKAAYKDVVGVTFKRAKAQGEPTK